MDMLNCTRCEGFIPAQASHCPHCDAQAHGRSRLGATARTLLNVAGGGAVAMTLMACYGGPPREYGPPPQTPTNNAQTCSDPSRDLDGDGFCENDCDEMNKAVFPGASDPEGDGVDQNCDGADGTKTDTIAE